jgi:hypothetical protein
LLRHTVSSEIDLPLSPCELLRPVMEGVFTLELAELVMEMDGKVSRLWRLGCDA